MKQSILNILHLSLKELQAIRRDTVMIVLIVFVFMGSTYIVADAISTEIRDMAVAVIDEDQSQLSARLTGAIRPPLFKTPVAMTPGEAQDALSAGRQILAVTIPPNFERDILAGRAVTLNIDVDATAVAQAGNGAAYMQQLLAAEITGFFSPADAGTDLVNVAFSNRFNPNLSSRWFTSVMQLMNSVTILTLILAGASLIREREHGTIEHVLVMPVRPHEIALSKILANGLVILVAAVAALNIVVQWVLGVPVAGSLILFAAGTALYVVAAASIGLLLGTFAKNMGQFGLLVIPTIVVIILLSGGLTPAESQPEWLRAIMQVLNPAVHFVNFTQSVLYRGAGLSLVWDQMLEMAAMAAVSLALTLARFRKVLAG